MFSQVDSQPESFFFYEHTISTLLILIAAENFSNYDPFSQPKFVEERRGEKHTVSLVMPLLFDEFHPQVAEALYYDISITITLDCATEELSFYLYSRFVCIKSPVREFTTLEEARQVAKAWLAEEELIDPRGS